MSFFDDASLAFLPSGAAGKDGKAYSIKPTDGTGDFTFSRGSNLAATRVGPTGLIEKGRENLLLQSNQFDTTPWFDSSTTKTGGQSGYDGTNDAWLLNKTGTSFNYIAQNITSSGVKTFSVYAKAGTLGGIRLLHIGGGNSDAYFNLNSGTIFSQDAQTIDAKIEQVGATDWYRCSFTNNESITQLRIYPITETGDFDTSGTIYIQDAQVEIGLAATEVISTGATTGKAGLLEDEPRFDYSGGATCPSLLLEPSRTNLIRYSEYYGSNLFVNSSPEINNATSPEGLQNATLLKEDTNSGNHAMREPSNTSIAADDSQYVISFFAKSNGRNIRFIDDAYAGSSSVVNFNLSSGGTFSNGFLIIDSDAVAFGDGWYYCYAVIDKAAPAQNNFRFSLRLLGGPSNDNDSYTGDGTSGVWIYGKEVNDAVSYPTSYIPNHSGGTITRGADSCTGAGDVNTFNSTEGVLYAEIADIADGGANRAIAISDGTTSNVVRFYYSTTANRIVGNVKSVGTNVFNFNNALTDSANFIKIALSYKANDFKMYVNGVLVATDTSGNAPIGLNELSFDNGGNFDDFYGKVKQVIVLPTALSDADCITLTTL
jgi:hypothetical protein